MSLDTVFRTEWPRVVALLVRDFGDVGLAEDCTQEAFLEAASRWAPDSIPERPGAWLTTTARRKALDRMRRSANYESKLAELEVKAKRGAQHTTTELIDEQLALLLGCCHPALNLEAQVALTLRLVAGLTVEQIARAFLVEEATMGKRITRAKHKIRSANIPFAPVDRAVLVERVQAVCRVVYLIFTEGHASQSDEAFVRGDLCDEAEWLSRLVAELVPDDPETHGLHALICFTDARREARLDSEGAPVLMEDQDRSLWDADKIAAGLQSLSCAKDLGAMGPFGLQALIASYHCLAPDFASTNWGQIVRVYGALLHVDDSAVVVLNRAVALSFAESPQAGLDSIEPVREALAGYTYLHSTRAELLRRMGRAEEARTAYEEALGCGPSAVERRLLITRLDGLRTETPLDDS